MNFRHDINCLRAIAVIAVVVFHFKPEWLQGGFAGVDVFFVISGFLMTAIIFNGLERNTFNVFSFYSARANRIIPVLACMSLLMLIFGWFYLLAPDYLSLAKQIEKSHLFNSNLLFSKGGGYFDSSELSKWMLHTWSLSVEWQFYIYFPIILILGKRFLSLVQLKRLVLTLFILSFVYCIYATNKDQRTAYFLLSSRAWEMLIGGLAFLYPIALRSIKQRYAIQLTGLTLIVASYFTISKNNIWPGYIAFIPVFGAYLILVSNVQTNILLNNPVFNYVGKWSYSIYVWHWPLVVFGLYFSLQHWWMIGIPISILIGFISYQCIEKLKLPKINSWKEIYKLRPLYFTIFILACSLIIQNSKGMKFRYSEDILNTFAEVDNTNPYACDSGFRERDFELCKIGNQNNIKAIVIGDSHADSLSTAVAAVFDLKQQGIISISTASCPFILNANFYDPKNNCPELNQQRLELIQSKQYQGIPIILISRLTTYIEGQNDPERILVGKNPAEMYFGKQKDQRAQQLYAPLQHNMTKTLCAIKAYNPVFIMQPTPEIPLNVPKTVAKNKFLGLNRPILYTYQDYLARSAKVRTVLEQSADRCAAQILDPAQVLCKTGSCMTTYQDRPIYRDGDHLSEYGNKLLIPMFKRALLPDAE